MRPEQDTTRSVAVETAGGLPGVGVVIQGFGAIMGIVQAQL